MPHVAGTRVNVSVVALYKYVYRVKSIMLHVLLFYSCSNGKCENQWECTYNNIRFKYVVERLSLAHLF